MNAARSPRLPEVAPRPRTGAAYLRLRTGGGLLP